MLGASVVLCACALMGFVIHQGIPTHREPLGAAVELAADDGAGLDVRSVERWAPPPGVGEVNWEKVFHSVGR